jgi:anthranilate phosphoribosyltransferase
MYKTVMTELLNGRDLPRERAAAMMAEMMEGALEQSQAAALLTGLAIKGVTASELTGFAMAMRERALPVVGLEDTLDTCGTGGSGMSTINTSTMCAFVLASAGVRVAKHGNRSSSGKCGSADVLERLGVHLAATPEVAVRLLESVGMTFLYAPSYHPAMRHVMPVRRTIGFRTVFNFLGPLCNPARTSRQVIGVSDPRMADLMAHALAELGCERALVAHGEDGLDELTICAPTQLWMVSDGEVTGATMRPEDAGLKRAEPAAIQGGSVEENAAAFEAILTGAEKGPRADHVLLNAGAGLYIGDAANAIEEGVELARKQVESGAAWAKFCAYRDTTVAFAGSTQQAAG